MFPVIDVRTTADKNVYCFPVPKGCLTTVEEGILSALLQYFDCTPDCPNVGFETLIEGATEHYQALVTVEYASERARKIHEPAVTHIIAKKAFFDRGSGVAIGHVL